MAVFGAWRQVMKPAIPKLSLGLLGSPSQVVPVAVPAAAVVKPPTPPMSSVPPDIDSSPAKAHSSSSVGPKPLILSPSPVLTAAAVAATAGGEQSGFKVACRCRPGKTDEHRSDSLELQPRENTVRCDAVAKCPFNHYSLNWNGSPTSVDQNVDRHYGC
jgi:hypothetical protein